MDYFLEHLRGIFNMTLIDTGSFTLSFNNLLIALFIAVHPPVIMDTLDKMKQFITDDSLVVSLAPKINIEKINAKLGARNIVRMIPGATSYINEGYNPLCFAGSFESDPC